MFYCCFHVVLLVIYICKRDGYMNYLLLFLENIITYLYLVLMLRLLGKKEMSRITLFDFIVFLLLSELMTLSIGNDDISFVYGAFSVFIIVLVDKTFSYLTMKYKRFKCIVEGEPSYIIFNGEIDLEIMQKLNYSFEDLYHQVRQKDISSFSEIQFAVLETDGSLSVIKKQDNKVLVPDGVIIDGVMNEALLLKCGKNKEWLLHKLKEQGINNYKDVMICIVEKDSLYIKKGR